MTDLLFKTKDFVFSCRVAGILIHCGKVLLQKPTNDDGFAFPGGHVAFGETNEQALIREFEEEIGAKIRVGALRWVAEIFFPWGDKPCHQLCLYYTVSLRDALTPRDGTFFAREQLEGRSYALEFHWVPLDKIDSISLYPKNAAELLKRRGGGVRHFIYREP